MMEYSTYEHAANSVCNTIQRPIRNSVLFSAALDYRHQRIEQPLCNTNLLHQNYVRISSSILNGAENCVLENRIIEPLCNDPPGVRGYLDFVDTDLIAVII